MSGRNSQHRVRQGVRAGVVQMAVQQQRLVARCVQQGLCIAKFQRQMRLPAAEIDAVLEAPGRIDQGDPHAEAASAGA